MKDSIQKVSSGEFKTYFREYSEESFRIVDQTRCPKCNKVKFPCPHCHGTGKKLAGGAACNCETVCTC